MVLSADWTRRFAFRGVIRRVFEWPGLRGLLLVYPGEDGAGREG
jgi:hypothetical protein